MSSDRLNGTSFAGPDPESMIIRRLSAGRTIAGNVWPDKAKKGNLASLKGHCVSRFFFHLSRILSCMLLPAFSNSAYFLGRDSAAVFGWWLSLPAIRWLASEHDATPSDSTGTETLTMDGLSSACIALR